MFDAVIIEKNDGQQTASFRQIAQDQLPAGDVLVKVEW